MFNLISKDELLKRVPKRKIASEYSKIKIYLNKELKEARDEGKDAYMFCIDQMIHYEENKKRLLDDLYNLGYKIVPLGMHIHIKFEEEDNE